MALLVPEMAEADKPLVHSQEPVALVVTNSPFERALLVLQPTAITWSEFLGSMAIPVAPPAAKPMVQDCQWLPPSSER